MSDPSNSPLDLTNFGLDLAQSFQPAWVKESTNTSQISRLVQKYDDEGDRPGRRPRQDFRDRRDARPGGDRNRRPPRGREAGPGKDFGKRAPGQRDDRRDGPRDNRRQDREPRQIPTLSGWQVQFLSDPRGIEGLTKQLKSTGKAVPLFDLARLVLEKPERYSVELQRDGGPNLFQVMADGSVWLNENEAIAHILSRQIDRFYRRERVTVEAPKGAFTCVAECGMSGVLLGPPNHHDYQSNLRKVHSEKFSRMPFEAFKSRIRMLKDEATIQKWKDEQTQQDEYFPIDTAEGEAPLRLASLPEVERHFRSHFASREVVPAGDKVVIPGSTAINHCTPSAIHLVRVALDNLVRFPLPLAHILGHELTSRGLQIFKAHENITYVAVARPKFLDRTTNPVSEGISKILEFLENQTSLPRQEQWKGLLALFPLPEDGNEAKREASVVADLSWLIHQGHVIDYAKRGMEAARRSVPANRQQAAKPSPDPSRTS